MIAAVTVAIGVMLVSAEAVSGFVNRHPTVKMLALSFLLLIGFSLLLEGFGQHVPKGYIYFAMAFSIVELLNLRVRRRRRETPPQPVELHQRYAREGERTGTSPRKWAERPPTRSGCGRASPGAQDRQNGPSKPRRRTPAGCQPAGREDSVPMSGEPETQHGSAAFRVLGREVSALSAGKVAGDGEPEARPPAVAAPGAVRPVEVVEDAGRCSDATPVPVSATPTSTRRSSAPAVTSIRPLGGVCRKALSSKVVDSSFEP